MTVFTLLVMALLTHLSVKVRQKDIGSTKETPWRDFVELFKVDKSIESKIMQAKRDNKVVETKGNKTIR